MGGSRSPSPANTPSMRRSLSPPKGLRSTPILLEAEDRPDEARRMAESLLFDSLPRENVQDVSVALLVNDVSKARFLNLLFFEGNDTSRVRPAWHMAGSPAAAR